MAAPRSARTTGMSSLTVDMVARICDFLYVEESLRRSSTCRAFKDAIGKIRIFSCTSPAFFNLYLARPYQAYKVKINSGRTGMDDALVLGHPLTFARFAGAHSVHLGSDDIDDTTRFLVIVCSSPRRWRELRLTLEARSESPTAHLNNLAAAIRAGLLGDLQHIQLIDLVKNDLCDSGYRALRRLCSALPARAAVRLMIAVGFWKDEIIEKIHANPSLDLNETSSHLDPVAVTVASSIKTMNFSDVLEDVPELLHDLHERGLDLNCRRPHSHRSALSLAIENSYDDHVELGLDCAETMLDLGADPNGGSPSPLLALCGACEHYHLMPNCARLRRPPPWRPFIRAP